MDPRRTVSPESALASDIFDKFCSASTLKAILSQYRNLCSVIRLKPTHIPEFYPRLKAKLSSWRAQGLWSKFEKRASHKCYARGKACYGTRVLIIGAGPCGLRAAIEAQLLGAKVVLVEKRDRFSRNNVLHLWPFVITDLKALGAKKFYGKFCAGSIDHISIRQLQCILMKVALLLGVEIHEGVGFEGIREPTENEGWRAVTSPADHPVSHYNFDVLIGADGRRNTLEGFKRKALRAKLAIAITANFINKHTEAEARAKEISGVSYIFNQKFFQDLNEATGIDLENIVYYKDETHYFVMTAKKQSLLNKGVLLHDHADTAKLLSHENISSEALMIYALEAAIFSTENQLSNLEFAVNHYGQPDVAMFDFTAMYAAENACRVVQRKNHKLLMTLVGDSLLEPFWPTGSGCARGFLSSFDTCWMLRSWAGGTKPMLEVIAERESIYRLLGQTTPENLNKEHGGYTIDPHSRYPNLNLRVVMPFQVKSLYDTDEKIPDVGDGTLEQQMEVEKVSKKRRRDSVIAVDSLLSWLRDQVLCYGLEVSDVRDAFVRGDVLCAIIHRFRPDLIEFPLPSEENVDPLDTAAFRNQLAFDLLNEEYALTHVMSGFDSVQCPSADFLSLVAYLSQIYEIFRGEIPQTKYPRVESNDELDEQEQLSSHSHSKYNMRPAIVVKHGAMKPVSRRSRISSSGRDSREGDSETSRRHKKRRSDERSRGASGREIKTTVGGCLNAQSLSDSEKNVSGLARNLEEKLRGTRNVEKKPKDLVRAIGKIEKSDWNVQLIEKKIAESKGQSQMKKDREDKVPKWSREAFDDKREAMKRKMEGGATDKNNEKLQLFEETMKKLGNKLKEGNALEIGQRGCNKVSQMAEQLVHKLERPKEAEATAPKASVARPVFEFPKKGGSECCHFCKERVYVVERMTAEGKFFHRNCFRCEYCNTSLRVGNYVFDREGRYGERFYCNPHYTLIRSNGWKKYDQEEIVIRDEDKYPTERGNLLVPLPPTSQQILSEMDERGTTPERVEFENSVDFASEEELLSEMDEDEWTDRNFGASNADNNTSDEASDLSDDEDLTPEGNKEEQNQGFQEPPPLLALQVEPEDADPVKKKTAESSDSDTEVASGEVSEEEGSCEDDEDEDEDDEEEECGGSTTEIETDSEFAEDPPHSVPGKIPTIVVEEPEQLVTRLIESVPLSHTQTPPKRDGRSGSNHTNNSRPLPPQKLEDLKYRTVEPIKRGLPERQLPRVTAVPKKWEPLPRQEALASKMTLELKKKYLHGVNPLMGVGVKKAADPAAQNQFRSVLDMISEQQKLLQPAPKPSATMQAFLDGAEKLKNKRTISPLSGNIKGFDIIGGGSGSSGERSPLNISVGIKPKWTQNENESELNLLAKETIIDNGSVDTINMNRLNLEKTIEATNTAQLQQQQVVVEVEAEVKKEVHEEKEKGDFEKEVELLEKQPDIVPVVNGVSSIDKGCDHMQFNLDTAPSSVSHSETESQSTIIDTNRIVTSVLPVEMAPMLPLLSTNILTPLVEMKSLVDQIDRSDEECESDTETETGSAEPISELDDDDDDDEDIEVESPHIMREPPRVEIEDEFGVSLPIDVDAEVEIYLPKSEEMSKSEKEKSSESCQTQIPKPEENSLQQEPMKEEEEPSKSLGGMSSSDSRDSLNSGMFLETELSDWVKEGEGSVTEGRIPKRKNLRKKLADAKRRAEKEAAEKISKLKSNMTLDLEGMDFMDIDGMSSPEDIIEHVTRKQGYCKLASDDELLATTPEFEADSLNCSAKFDDVEDIDGIPRDSDESSRSSTPTIGSVSVSATGKIRSNAESKLNNTIGPPPTMDDDAVGNSNDAVIDDVKSNEVATKVFEEARKLEKGKVVHAVNPFLVNQNPVEVSGNAGAKEKYAILDRVVPFSNARDSLDYRKMKGMSSPIKSKDLYSTYAVPSVSKVQSSLFTEKICKHPLKPTLEDQNDDEDDDDDDDVSDDDILVVSRNKCDRHVQDNAEALNVSLNSELAHCSSAIGGLETPNGSFDLNKSSTTSPSTARRIEEINKERVKQSDLIRSMVMGRIRRSPEKNRRGSRGSLSPLGASSSPSSASGSSEQVMLKSDDNEIDSRRSSQNSILSQSQEGETTETDDSHHNSSSHVDILTSGDDSIAEAVVSSADVSQKSSSSVFSSDNNIPHHQMTTNTTTSSVATTRSNKSQHYEPVFTSSPRFRNRPKFDSPLSIYQSVTNPPTPVNPSTPLFPPSTSVFTPGSESSSGGEGNPSKLSHLKGSSPSFYRSMPDLTAFMSGSSNGHGKGMMQCFATPNVKQWEAYKNCAASGDRETARLAARERARLKSDEELGLSPTDYINVKDKLRRKVSVPEDEVFDPSAAIVVSVPSTPNSSSASDHHSHSSRSGDGGTRARPLSDVYDAVASSIRHNVDFPIKRNPFLVSPTESSSPISSKRSKESAVGEMSDSANINLCGGIEEVEDDFVHLRLRLTPKSQTPERKVSPEKAKSVGWDTIPDSFPNYFTPISPSTCNPPSSFTTIRNDQNWLLEKADTPVTRPRSNTLSELIFTAAGQNSPPGTSSSNYSQQSQSQSHDVSQMMMPLSHRSGSVALAASAAINNHNSSSNSNPSNTHNNNNYTIHTPQPSQTTTKPKAKAKALSSDTLLEDSPLSPQSSEPYRGVSVPDITHENPSPERKVKKSKDRDRRRSLIQAVSDFFTSRSSSGSNSNSTDKGADLERSLTSSSSAGVSPSKDKFSLFKLTPKLLQSKEKRSSKSREMLAPSPSQSSQGGSGSEFAAAPAKSPRSGFISYLTQPEMVIQKLSASPTSFKSSRVNLNARSESNSEPSTTGQQQPQLQQPEPMPPQSFVTPPNRNSTSANRSAKANSDQKRNEARRMREIQEIQLQLDSIESEQRVLESRGVTIEKKLRGEEQDEEQRDDAEMMEVWFTLVREKTRLARFERELIVRAKDLELEERQERLEEKLDRSLLVNDIKKSPEDKSREIEILHELRAVEQQRGSLLSRFHEDMKKYESEDADLEAKIASSSLSPRESNV